LAPAPGLDGRRLGGGGAEPVAHGGREEIENLGHHRHVREFRRRKQVFFTAAFSESGKGQNVGDGHEGISCVKPADSHVSRLVNRSTPMTSSTPADARSMARRWLLTNRSNGRVLSSANARAMNGRPSPRQ